MGEMADYYEARDEERWEDPDGREYMIEESKRLLGIDKKKTRPIKPSKPKSKKSDV